MKQKKKNILEKIVKKDYNNELEITLEEKKYSENAKNALLSILYKIEAAYKDFETVKKDVETKEEYILNFFNIVKNECNSIEIVKMTEENSKIPENKTYIIDKENKKIISYPIERKLLYAINKIGNKDKIIKDKYFIIDETLSNLINVGHNINMVEPLRDFNGFSWTSIPEEIESIDHNLIYQNLRIILGYQFLDKWVANNEFMIDYYEQFKEILDDKYDTEKRRKIIDIISKLSVLLEMKFDNEKKEELKAIKKQVKEELQRIEDKENFTEEITELKIEITEKIKDIDTIINNKKLLEKEYKKRNESLPFDKKIFSMRVLSKILQDEKEHNYKELEKLNDMLNPMKFLKYKKDLEDKYKYLKVVDSQNKDKELNKLKTNLQKLFLKLLEINVSKCESKQEIEKIIYDYRYYMLLQYDYKNEIRNLEELKDIIDIVGIKIIEKAIELKAIQRISNDKKTNYEILKNLFNVRIIKLEDSYLKLIKEKDRYFVQIFDENIIEDKVQIQKPKELIIKPNKKIAIWC